MGLHVAMLGAAASRVVLCDGKQTYNTTMGERARASAGWRPNLLTTAPHLKSFRRPMVLRIPPRTADE
jgi:hypothetical protein